MAEVATPSPVKRKELESRIPGHFYKDSDGIERSFEAQSEEDQFVEEEAEEEPQPQAPQSSQIPEVGISIPQEPQPQAPQSSRIPEVGTSIPHAAFRSSFPQHATAVLRSHRPSPERRRGGRRGRRSSKSLLPVDTARDRFE